MGLTLLYSECQKLHRVLSVLSAIGLKSHQNIGHTEAGLSFGFGKTGEVDGGRAIVVTKQRQNCSF